MMIENRKDNFYAKLTEPDLTSATELTQPDFTTVAESQTSYVRTENLTVEAQTGDDRPENLMAEAQTGGDRPENLMAEPETGDDKPENLMSEAQAGDESTEHYIVEAQTGDAEPESYTVEAQPVDSNPIMESVAQPPLYEAARETPVNYIPIMNAPEQIQAAAPEQAQEAAPAAAPETAPPNYARRPENAAMAGLLINSNPLSANNIPQQAAAPQPLYIPPIAPPAAESAGHKPRHSKKKSKRNNRVFVGGIRRGVWVALLMMGLLLASAVGFAGGLMANDINLPQPVLYAMDTPTYLTEASALPSPVLPAAITTASDLSGRQALTTAQVAAIAADAVVEIVTEREVQVPNYGFGFGFDIWGGSGGSSTRIVPGAGSGVILTEDGYVITNNHVIEKVDKIEVTLRNGQSYSATLVATDVKTDVAVLKIAATGLRAAAVGDSDALVVGEPAVVIGNPLGQLGGTVTSGIISALDRPISFREDDGSTRTMNLLQTDAAVNGGNSGGGLFNQFGDLVGIVVAKSEGIGVEGLGFAIPINDVRGVIDDLISYGYARGRIALGVTLININDEQSAFSYRVEEPGVYIYRVEKNSNAERAGLKQGDHLLNVKGQDITEAEQVSGIIQQLSVGDKLKVTYKRDGETQTVEIVMQETVPAELPATKTGK